MKNKSAIYKNFNFETKLDSVDKKRIYWEYVVDVNNEKKNNPSEVHIKYIYVRKAQKLITRIDFGAHYVDLEGISEKCTET